MNDEQREKRKAQGRAYYLANKEKIRAKNDAWRLANPERYKEVTARYNAANKDKVRETSARWYRENKARAAATSRRLKLKRYGLTLAQYNAMLEHQHYECAICQRMLAHPVTPTVDHSHVTGATRGILCRRCNAALGLLEENTDNLERAMEYLSTVRLSGIRKLLSGVTSTTSSGHSKPLSTQPG